MGLFDKLFGSKQKESQEIKIYAPLTGEIVNIEDVPDVVFSEKIVGDGVAIRPSGDTIVAPVNGTIGKILKPTTLFRLNLKKAWNYLFTSVLILLN
ncbi:PTS system glucose-specific EIIA component [Mannheimia haemolytica]